MDGLWPKFNNRFNEENSLMMVVFMITTLGGVDVVFHTMDNPDKTVVVRMILLC